MAKYLITWESDMSRMSTDPKEQAAMRMKMLEMIKQNLKEGRLIDWGTFLGGYKGYAIGQGNALDMAMGVAKFSPYVKFEVQEVLSVDEMLEAMKSLKG
jgi:uncharacterized protein YciI